MATRSFAIEGRSDHLREVHMCLQVALAFGYVASIDPQLASQINDATSMTVGLAR